MRTRPRDEPEPEVRREEIEDTSKAPLQDPFEKYVGQFPKESQDWLRAHPDYVKDPRLNKRLQAAALEWDAEGKPLHTSDFIEHLNGKFFPQKEDPVIEEEDDGETEEVDASEPVAAPVKAKSAPAAPVSRSSQPTRGSDKRTTKVQLTVAEREHAIAMLGPGTRKNLSPEDAMKQYAYNRRLAETEGKLEKR